MQYKICIKYETESKCAVHWKVVELTLLRMKYLQMKNKDTDTRPARIGEINHDNTATTKHADPH